MCTVTCHQLSARDHGAHKRMGSHKLTPWRNGTKCLILRPSAQAGGNSTVFTAATETKLQIVSWGTGTWNKLLNEECFIAVTSSLPLQHKCFFLSHHQMWLVFCPVCKSVQTLQGRPPALARYLQIRVQDKPRPLPYWVHHLETGQ